MLLLEFFNGFGKRLVVDGAVVWGNAKPLAQCRHAIVLHADFEHRPIVDRRFLAIAFAGADVGELGLERQIAGSMRLVGIERRRHVV